MMNEEEPEPIRLGTLPKTRPWKDVIGILESDPNDIATLTKATIHATKQELESLKNEPSISYSFWLLTRITWFARQQNFVSSMEQIGVDLVGSSSALSFISAVSDHNRKQFVSYQGSTVFREIANLALKQALSNTVAVTTPSLFGSTIDDIQAACKKYSSKKQFGILSRHFFSSFFTRSLHYFIDKELSNHIGPGKRLATIEDGRAFSDALTVYAWQTSKIIEDFAAGWYSKQNWKTEGEITLQDAHKFVTFALRKFQMELNREDT